MATPEMIGLPTDRRPTGPPTGSGDGLDAGFAPVHRAPVDGVASGHPAGILAAQPVHLVFQLVDAADLLGDQQIAHIVPADAHAQLRCERIPALMLRNAAVTRLARRRCDVIYSMLKNGTLHQDPALAA